MALIYSYQHDIGGYNGFGRLPCDLIYSASLAATTDTTLTVPGSTAKGYVANNVNNRFIAIIRVEPDASVFFAVNDTAAAPVGGTFATTTSELLSSMGEHNCYVVKSGDVLHFLATAADVDVTVSLYSMPAA